jgi:hypothetical protein
MLLMKFFTYVATNAFLYISVTQPVKDKSVAAIVRRRRIVELFFLCVKSIGGSGSIAPLFLDFGTRRGECSAI